MSYKLIMNWDIKNGLDQDYFEFVVREWIPATTGLGLQVIAAWYTLYSSREEVPKIMAEGLTDDKASMRRILNSTEWRDIQTKLLDYVDNYQQKVVEVNGRMQF